MAVKMGIIGVGGIAYGGNAYDHCRKLYESEELDAVGIFVPPDQHGEIEQIASERGIPMLIEKPCAVNMAMAREVEGYITKSGVVNAVAYKYRWDGHVRKAQELLADARIGLVHGWFWGGMPGTPWWRKDAESGGQFIEQTTHIFDLARHLVGEVKSVQSWMGMIVPEYEGGPHDVHDVGTANLVFENGALGNISNTCMVAGWGSSGLRVMAEGFTLEICGNQLTWAGKNVSGEETNSEDGYAGEDAAFIDAVITGDRSRIFSDYSDSVKSLALSVAAKESDAAGGAVVNVADVG